jgi:cyanosortase A-associated protein
MKAIPATKNVRIAILGVLSLGIIGVLGQILVSNPGERPGSTRTAFTFPEMIDLPNWQPVSSQAIDHTQVNHKDARRRLIAGQIYQYEQGDRQLTVATVYNVDTNGRVNNFLKEYTSIPHTLTLSQYRIERYRERVGYYVLFEDQKNAYLASCINPRGESTVTIEQFNKNRYNHDIRPERLLRWLLNAESIRDFRCLWVSLSTPIAQQGTDEAFSTLEGIWFFWHDWWKPRFPQP